MTQATQRPLLSWAPDDVEEPTAGPRRGRAGDLGGRPTVTFRLREGVEFAPPVDREVTSADVKYAIERTVLPGVLNGYVANYASDIVGFEEAAKEAEDNPTGGAPDMEGITTPDDYTLQIELNEPEVATATTVASMLSLPISAPVPEEFAKEFDAKNPTSTAST